MTTTTVRNASLEDLAEQLRSQHQRKIDIVASADKLSMVDGVLRVAGADAQLDDDGVTSTDGSYLPTAIFDEGLADKLRIPLAYLRRMRNERIGLYDANVNGWLRGEVNPGHEGVYVGDPDTRKFLLRCFRGDDSDRGVARAFLSDMYKTIDHFDAITAALTGVRQADVEVQIQSCDLSDRRMVVRVFAPQITVLAPQLLAGYRSPFTGQTGEELPVVFAGFEFSNSEVGDGAFTIVPRMIFEICRNGAKITKDALRAVHLGGKLEEGVVKWSAETNKAQLELITAKTTDAVRTFLDVGYMTGVIEEMTEKAGKAVDVTSVVQNVGKKLSFSEDTINGVLEHFIRGGQMTAGGVMQAVTSYAQTVDDADLAFTLEEKAVEALALAAK